MNCNRKYRLFRHFLLQVVLLLALVSCQDNTSIELSEVDTVAWKKDKEGCQALRADQVEQLMAQKEKFIGTNQKRVFATLGKPDRVELDTRMKRTHFYFLEKSPECENFKEGEIFRALSIEYDPVNRDVKTISIARVK